MASLTLKGLPDELLDKLREIADEERRSLTQEAILMLEESVRVRTERKQRGDTSTRQADAWRKLAGRWKSERTVDEEIEEIYEARTSGRQVDL